jgi:hypothetical protein
MRHDLLQTSNINDVLRNAALLALWPRCIDASVERYACRIPYC